MRTALYGCRLTCGRSPSSHLDRVNNGMAKPAVWKTRRVVERNGDQARTDSGAEPVRPVGRFGGLVFLEAADAIRVADLLLHEPSNATAEEQALIPALLADHAGLVVLDTDQCGRLGVFLAGLGGRSRWADTLADAVFVALAAVVFNQPH